MTKSNKLTLWIFIAMVLGIGLGAWYRSAYPDEASLKAFGENISILTDIFLRLVKMIIAPLVLSTLIVGVAKLGDLKSVGRIGGRALLWFISASLMSLLLGMFLVNLFEPGVSLGLPLPDATASLSLIHI